jgi:hypothetical protein
MKSLATPALLTLSALAFAFIQGETTPVRAQPAPVQAEQTPRQSDQSREQDRARAEDVRIGPDWKAQEGGNDRPGHAVADKDHETIGRDWRAHPDNRDR